MADPLHLHTSENMATVEDILNQLGATQPSLPGRSAVHWSAGCWTVRDCHKSVTTRSVLCLRFVCWAITHHTTVYRVNFRLKSLTVAEKRRA